MSPSANPRSVYTGDQPARLQLVPASRELQPAVARGLAARPARRIDALDLAIHRWLIAHSVSVLRVSLGVVFLGFGFLKFFGGVSPAEELATTTTSMLTFDLVPGAVAIIAIAALECIIGLWLLSGRALRGVVYLLAVQLVGILSPAVLLADRLFSGPYHAPTLEGQYVLKDVIILGAVLVLAATLRGGRLTSGEEPGDRPRAEAAP